MTTATATSITGVFWRPCAALRVATGAHRDRRLAAALVAAIAAFTIVAAAAPTASSLDTGIPETAVAAQTHADHALVEPEQPVSPTAVGDQALHGYDGASGCCVAPRTAAIGPPGSPGELPRVTTPRAQLEAKFKHAADFGVIESRGASGFDAFGKSVADFVAVPSTVRVRGTYRGNSAVLNYDLTTRQIVVQRPNGEFWTGFQMSPAQALNVLLNASLGGG